jgi:hypothetical protein
VRATTVSTLPSSHRNLSSIVYSPDKYLFRIYFFLPAFNFFVRLSGLDTPVSSRHSVQIGLASRAVFSFLFFFFFFFRVRMMGRLKMSGFSLSDLQGLFLDVFRGTVGESVPWV